MTNPRLTLPAVALTLIALAAAGCGSSGTKSPSSGGSGSASSAADAKSAATGDIPDNQVFLTFHDRAAGYAIQYPEGWTQKGTGADVAFREKENSIHVVVARATAPTAAGVRAALARLKASAPTLRAGAPATVKVKHGSAIKVSYSEQGRPDPVTGKRSKLLVDRYVYARGGKVATVDLSTPKGVDNVDAYRLISHGFAWR